MLRKEEKYSWTDTESSVQISWKSIQHSLCTPSDEPTDQQTDTTEKEIQSDPPRKQFLDLFWQKM